MASCGTTNRVAPKKATTFFNIKNSSIGNGLDKMTPRTLFGSLWSLLNHSFTGLFLPDAGSRIVAGCPTHCVPMLPGIYGVFLFPHRFRPFVSLGKVNDIHFVYQGSLDFTNDPW